MFEIALNDTGALLVVSAFGAYVVNFLIGVSGFFSEVKTSDVVVSKFERVS